MEDYKVAIIHGNNNEERNIREGQIEKLGDFSDEEQLHSACLLDYANEKYKDAGIFKQLNYRHKAETIGYFLTMIDNNIVFFNVTKNAKKYGKMGLMLMPEDITPVQREALYDFIETIPDFSIDIFYNLSIVDGILAGKEIFSAFNETPKSVLDSYFNLKQEETKTVKK